MLTRIMSNFEPDARTLLMDGELGFNFPSGRRQRNNVMAIARGAERPFDRGVARFVTELLDSLVGMESQRANSV